MYAFLSAENVQLASTLWYAVAAIAGLAIIALTVITFRWSWVESWYIGYTPKLLVALARLCSATATVGTRFVGPTKKEASEAWNSVFVVAIISWFLWELVQIMGDWRGRKTAKKIGELTRQSYIRTSLLSFLRRLVMTKAERLQSELINPSPKSTPIHRLRDALIPDTQIYLILENMALFLKWLDSSADSETQLQQNFRIGLYVAQGGVMKPEMAFDLNDHNYDPFVSHQAQQENFRLDAQTVAQALVVRCVRERSLFIVPDCEKAANCGEFTYFRDAQRKYLKSIVAYPILNYRQANGTITEAALVVDTDIPGHFKEADRKTIEIYMDEFAARLKLETVLSGLLGG